VVAKAPVTITQTATGQTRTVNTDDQGIYSAPDLLPGNYQITVKAPNFKESVTNNVELHVASIVTQNIKLQVGGSTETIEVSANNVQVQTDSAALGEVIDGGQVKELPLNGRSFVQLTQLAPGVSAANNFDTKNKGLQGGVDFSVNGNPTTNNLFLINGANNNDVGSNRTILIYPSIEAIAEFKLLTNSYGPEYGQASGGVINLITKSGTNDFHGSVFYSGRNSALAATEYFAARTGKKDQLQRHDYGFSIGGPVKKEKLFFFYSEEWNKEKRGITRSACVPTAAERAGDLSTVSCNAPVPNIAALQAAG
jgi:outer membrane receptor for ferrienterochelin and colicin